MKRVCRGVRPMGAGNDRNEAEIVIIAISEGEDILVHETSAQFLNLQRVEEMFSR